MFASYCLHQNNSFGKRRKKLAALKVDFSKAFDRLSWQFIIACLRRTNFLVKWKRLIYQCISTVEYYIQLNGQISFTISPSCSIRQGIPLSPYLCIIASNILSCMIHQSESQGLWRGIKICKEASPITHLLYADDSLFFLEANIANFMHVKQILDCYCRWSGQKINKSKLILIFSPSTTHADRSGLAGILHISYSPKLGKHLGTWIDPGRQKSEV